MTAGAPMSFLTSASVLARTAAADPLAPRPWPPSWATTSGPLVAALVCRYGWLVTPCRTSPRVSVAVAAVIASTSSTAGPGRCRRSRPTRRPMSDSLPMTSRRFGLQDRGHRPARVGKGRDRGQHGDGGEGAEYRGGQPPDGREDDSDPLDRDRVQPDAERNAEQHARRGG